MLHAFAETPTLDTGNTSWLLVSTALVLLMTPGLAMFYGGLNRSKSVLNMMMMSFSCIGLISVLWIAYGFSFAFGTNSSSGANNIIGSWTQYLGSKNFVTEIWTVGGQPIGIPTYVVLAFQMMFAIITVALISGSISDRTKFSGWLVFAFGWFTLVYVPVAHWIWGGGYLGSNNFRDFAGSTVVHTIGGMVALAGSIVLGPRLGRTFKRDGGAPMLPHDLTIAVSGGLILWFGWYGFNPGSTLSAMDFEGIGRVAANTTLAACAGGLAAMFVAYMYSKKWDAGFTTNGFLAGLVAITCPCYWVTPAGSIMLGAVAGVVVVLGVELLEYLRIDDPIGAVPVHGMCGIWGTISLGLFASGQFGVTGPIGITVTVGAGAAPATGRHRLRTTATGDTARPRHRA